ncbi:hypothetical protein D2V17_18275 [Aurantiacibacter xanthus]|uniref:Glycosyltransferase RgtA/B/C/D-like domain-containing protein n=1 Tax=Aurantiacibacter xanthus TaxID=1784712 RepID=A0A3A1NZH3_9SPHN|nr:hypothetical protein [Aurantiacibacter xanthus]RIV80853.1 hypothetical protein D2V17_18275 [Aurantiacibacter xanthus]
MSALRSFPPVLWLLVAAAILRAQTFGNPVIEFDEQYYLLVGERMLDGALPYVDIWDRKPIGLFVLFAAFAWIGQLLGGDGLLASQIGALVAVVVTAELIRRMALRAGADGLAALLAGLGYIIWLNLAQGEGTQASVLYTPLVVGAAFLVQRRAPHLARDGAAAMALVGLAIQIKYTAGLEGLLFGLWLIVLGHRRGWSFSKVLSAAAVWALLVLLPTLLTAAIYGYLGALDAFLFANFQSQFLRVPDELSVMGEDLLGSVAILLLPVALLLATMRREDLRARSFEWQWLAAALAAILIVGAYSPHYFIPLLAPLFVVLAPAFGRWRKVGAAVLALGTMAGQFLLHHYEETKGGRAEAMAMVEAIGEVPGCLYVHDGFPALYRLSQSCLPTPFAFPGSLNMANEANALGVDSRSEVERIFMTRPDAVVTDLPAYNRGNRVTQAIVQRELAQNYVLTLRLKTGSDRYRLVYRRRD